MEIEHDISHLPNFVVKNCPVVAGFLERIAFSDEYKFSLTEGSTNRNIESVELSVQIRFMKYRNILPPLRYGVKYQTMRK